MTPPLTLDPLEINKKTSLISKEEIGTNLPYSETSIHSPHFKSQLGTHHTLSLKRPIPSDANYYAPNYCFYFFFILLLLYYLTIIVYF